MQLRLSKAAANAVSELLPAYADNDLSSVCSWADRVKFRYHWSRPLHYIDTPDNLCTYQYSSKNIILHLIHVSFIKINKISIKKKKFVDKYAGDCKDEDGIKDRCVAGAINNYTTQLLSYGNSNSKSQCKNLNFHIILFVLLAPSPFS